MKKLAFFIFIISKKNRSGLPGENDFLFCESRLKRRLLFVYIWGEPGATVSVGFERWKGANGG